ncbi:MAG: YfiR/HmsC family protein [Putridiphycobacter sp.]
MKHFCLFILLWFSFIGFSQNEKDENYVKASLLLNFLEETTFENQKDIDTFNILIIDNDLLYEQTLLLAQKIQIKSNPLKVDKVSGVDFNSDYELIYLSQNFEKSGATLFKANNRSLIVSDGFSDLTHTNINLVKTSDNTIRFNINAENFQKHHLSPSSNLLVYANATKETIELIEQTKADLTSIKEDYATQLNLIKEINEKLSQKINLIKNKEKEIAALTSEINQKENNLIQKDEQLDELNESLQKKEATLKEYIFRLQDLRQELDNKADTLNVILDQLKEQQSNLSENQKTLLSQQEEIENQKQTISETDQLLDSRTKNLWWLGFFSLIILILLYFILRENSAKKASLQLVEEQNKKIVEASQHKDIFISNLSHEVRTPLNSIIGYSNILKQNSLKDEDQNSLNNILLASKNLLNIINDILDIKKIEAGQSELQSINFDIKSVLENVYKSLTFKAKEKGLRYELVMDDHLPDYLVGDPVKLHQILLNLLNNAIKFTEVGSVKLLVNINDKTEKNCLLEFAVLDTGRGIESKNLNKVFDSFVQENKSISKKHGGTGLGLAISQKFVKLMGGEIKVSSEKNFGSEFKFSIPFPISTEGSSTPIENLSRNIVIENSQNVRLIYADDLEINRSLLLKQFSLFNPNIYIDTVNNGKALVEACSQNKYDLIITDIRMPQLNGDEAAKLIRKFDENIPIIGLSANALETDIDNYMNSGLTDYLLKPYNFNDLLRKIANHLNLKYHLENSKKTENRITFLKLRQICNSDEEFKQTLTKLFDDINANLETLEIDCTNADVAHSLLNKLNYIEDEDVHQKSILLEKFAKTENNKQCQNLIGEIKIMVKDILAHNQKEGLLP